MKKLSAWEAVKLGKITLAIKLAFTADKELAYTTPSGIFFVVIYLELSCQYYNIFVFVTCL